MVTLRRRLSCLLFGLFLAGRIAGVPDGDAVRTEAPVGQPGAAELAATPPSASLRILDSTPPSPFLASGASAEAIRVAGEGLKGSARPTRLLRTHRPSILSGSATTAAAFARMRRFEVLWLDSAATLLAAKTGFFTALTTALPPPTSV